jgi:hypothetical protein
MLFRCAEESADQFFKQNSWRIDMDMDKNDFEGKWPLLRSQSKVWWSLITDEDLERVDKAEIKFFEFVSILQLKYALDRQTAKDQIAKRVKEYEIAQEIKVKSVDPR